MSVMTQHAPREARDTRDFTGGIAELADGKLYALQHQFALDGRVSAYPASARGFSVANSYLLKAGRRGAADRHRLRQGRAGDPRRDRVADRARLGAVAVPAAAQRVHVDQQRRDLRRAFQRRPVLHQQSGRGAVVRFRHRQQPRHPGFDDGHRGDPGGHDRARQARPKDRRHAGADPADRDALAVRPRDQDAVQLRHVHPCLARQRDRPVDRHRYGQRLDIAARGALVHAEHALLVARRRADRFDPARHRRGVRQIRHRDASRRATAASCAAARWWRGTTRCWTIS